jgi:hypothetical protein
MHVALAGVMGLICLFGVSGQVKAPASAAHPDFSGAWVFDAAKSSAMVTEGTHQTVSALLGDECVISHANAALSMVIRAGAQTVPATYLLDGRESRNMSPGPFRGAPEIPIVSRTQWTGTTLEITTASESDVDGRKVPVESVRRLWLTPSGDLAIVRSGTPAKVVPAAAAVYRRK